MSESNAQKALNQIVSHLPSLPSPIIGEKRLEKEVGGPVSAKKQIKVRHKVEQQSPNSGLSKRLRGGKKSYTIAKKHIKLIDDGEPNPGSLEQDLTATPDTFFSEGGHLLPPLAKISFNPAVKNWETLSPLPADGQHTKAQEAIHPYEKTVSVRFQANKSQGPLSKEGFGKSPKRPVRRIEVSDEELANRYKALKEKMKVSVMETSVPSSGSVLQQHYEAKHERSFHNYEHTQHLWEQHQKAACKSLGRTMDESVINRAEGYREKIERISALEKATPSAVKYGPQNWYLSLRSSPYIKEVRNYAMQFGNSYNGLWMNIMDHQTKQVEMILKPNTISSKFKTFKDSPFYKEKMAKESKRINELIPVNEITFTDFQIVGQNAFKVEYKAFKKCKGQKVLDVATLEEDQSGTGEYDI